MASERAVVMPLALIVAMRKREGYAAAQSSEATVVLDTELTPALVAEGIARDFVRVVQDARKQLEFNIEDTIDLRYVADDEAAAAIESHSDYVQREVLAETLTRADDVAGAEGHAIVKVGNETVKIAISRVS